MTSGRAHGAWSVATTLLHALALAKVVSYAFLSRYGYVQSDVFAYRGVYFVQPEDEKADEMNGCIVRFC
jgi:hypothetical protein